MVNDTCAGIVTNDSDWKISKEKMDTNIYGMSLSFRNKHWENCQKYFHIQKNNFEGYLKLSNLHKKFIYHELYIWWLMPPILEWKIPNCGVCWFFETKTQKKTCGGSSSMRKEFFTTKKAWITWFLSDIPFSLSLVMDFLAYLSSFLPYPYNSVISTKLRLSGDTQPSIPKLLLDTNYWN